MSSDQARALRGSCHCGRNQYIIEIPGSGLQEVQIRFDTDRNHRISSAAPLSAHLRVPLTWYRSHAFALFPDETRSSIRRTYSNPSHSQRVFCGICSTPLSYWSEEPQSEAEYIQLTLGSLLIQDLRDLEDLGIIRDDSEDADEMDVDPVAVAIPAPALSSDRQLIGREFTNIPWFENLLHGSRLGTLRTTKGSQQSRDGRARVEWEITEWTAGDDAEEAESSESSATGKRKRGQSAHDGTATEIGTL